MPGSTHLHFEDMEPDTSGSTPDGELLDDGDPAERRSAPTERVVAVINFLARQSGPVTLGQIAEGTGITRGTCLPLLRSLVASGWVVRHPRLRHYLLGQVPVALETMAREEDTWYAEARRACDDVAKASRLRVTLSVVVDLELVVIYQSIPPDPLPTTHTMPLYGRAGGRSPFAAPYGATLAAWMSAAERKAWIERGAPEVASQAAELGRRLDGIRARGFNVHRYTPMALEVQDLFRAGILGRDEGLRAAAHRVIASVGVEPLTQV